ncbi:hypothetical protein [Roseivirga echinicomitans]|nr:hypothetical protein [Roseivirga echinicomitans]
MEASVLIFGFSEISEPLQRFRDQMQEVELRYYASDILEKNGYNNLGEFEKVLDRVQTILITAHVAMENHIRITFRGEFSQIYRDYKLSSLAYHLVRMNGSPQNQQVALYQIETYTVLNQSLN